MSAVEPLVVLRAVVDSVVALGFPTTRIYVQEDGTIERSFLRASPKTLHRGSTRFASRPSSGERGAARGRGHRR